MLQNLLTSIIAFISTNIDDIFILILFFSAKDSKALKLISGQYLGILTLVLISFLGSYIGNFIDQRYVGILGLFPIYLAIKQLIAHFKSTNNENNEDIDPSITTSTILTVAGVTIANGADNLGVYIPLMTTMRDYEKIQMVIVFMFMTYLWCIIAQYLASHPLVAKQLNRYGHIITPFVLLFLGMYILIDSKTYSLLIHLD